MFREPIPAKSITRRGVWCHALCVVLLLTFTAGADQPAPPSRVDAFGDPLPEGAIARLGSVRFCHNNGGARCVAFSPRGDLLASGGNEGVRIWRTSTFQLDREWATAHNDDPTAICFSSDGKLVAFAISKSSVVRKADVPVITKADGRVVLRPDVDIINKVDIRIIELASGKLRAQVLDVADDVRALGFAKSDTLLMVQMARNRLGTTIALYDIATKDRIHEFKSAGCAAICPIKGIAVTEDQNSELRLWNVNERRVISTVPDLRGKPMAIAISADGATVAVATGKELALFDGAAGHRKDSPLHANDEITQIAFSGDGALLAFSGADRTLRVWNIKDRREVAVFDSPDSDLFAFAPDNRMFVYASIDGGAISAWDPTTWKMVFPVSAGRVSSLVWTPDGKSIITGDETRNLYEWDTETGGLRRLIPQTGPVYDIAILDSEGNRDNAILALRTKGELLFRDLTRRNLIRLLKLEPELARSSLSPDWRIGVTSYGPRKDTAAVDIASGKEISRFPISSLNPPISYVFGRPVGKGFSRDGRLVAMAVEELRSDTVALWLWNVEDGKRVLLTKEPTFHVEGLAFSPDSQVLAVMRNELDGRGNARVILWEIASRKEIAQIRLPEHAIYGFAFAPDGWSFATATAAPPQERILGIWDLRDYRELKTYHENSLVNSDQISYSPYGERIATFGGEVALIWPAITGHGDRAPASDGTESTFESLWKQLSGSPADANAAIFDFARRGDDAVMFLSKCLESAPARGSDADRVRSLIHDLDDDRAEVVQRAYDALLALGPEAAPDVRAAIAAHPTTGARERLDALSEEFSVPFVAPPALLQQIRAIRAIRLVGSPAAHDLLKRLANGRANAPLTDAAKEALAGHARPNLKTGENSK